MYPLNFTNNTPLTYDLFKNSILDFLNMPINNMEYFYEPLSIIDNNNSSLYVLRFSINDIYQISNEFEFKTVNVQQLQYAVLAELNIISFDLKFANSNRTLQTFEFNDSNLIPKYQKKYVEDLIFKDIVEHKEFYQLRFNDDEEFKLDKLYFSLSDQFDFTQSKASDIYDLILNYLGLTAKYQQLDQDSIIDFAKKEYEKKYQEYPELDNQSSIKLYADKKNYNLIEIIQSRIYGLDLEQSSLLLKELLEYKVVKDIITFLGVGIAQGSEFPISPLKVDNIEEFGFFYSFERKEPFKILFTNNCQSDSSGPDFDIGGSYNSKYNVVAIYNNYNDIIIHESTHAAMQLMFDNQAKPYRNNETLTYKNFQQAKIDIFEKILDILEICYDGGAYQEFYEEYLIDFLSNETDLPIFVLLHNNEHIKVTYYANRIKSIYNIETDEMFNKLDLILEKFDLNESKKQFLSTISMIAELYSASQFDSELIAYSNNLYIKALDQNDIELLELIAPIIEFWENNITPIINHQLSANQNFCMKQYELTGAIFDFHENFEFCIEEYLS